MSEYHPSSGAKVGDDKFWRRSKAGALSRSSVGDVGASVLVGLMPCCFGWSSPGPSYISDKASSVDQDFSAQAAVL